jgi:H+/Cl- antiporter ClcA
VSAGDPDPPDKQATDAEPAPAIDSRAHLRLIVLGAVIGLPAAGVAAAFLALVHLAEHWLWTDLPAALGAARPPWYLVLGLPIVGATVVLAARRLLPGDGGHPATQGLSMGPTPLSHLPGITLVALGSLACGAVLGPEAPLVALGCAVGGVIAGLARLGPRESSLLTAAGAFSAIAALFGGPLVASFMLIESGVRLGAALIPSLLPGLVASAVGYLIFIGLGDWGGVSAAGLTVPSLPDYHETSVRDLVVAVLVGVVAAAVATAAKQFGAAITARAQRLGVAVPLLLGGLVLGAGARGARPGRELAGRAVLRAGLIAGGGRRDVGRRGGDPPACQGDRLRGQRGRRLPGRPRLPAHVPGVAVAMIPQSCSVCPRPSR